MLHSMVIDDFLPDFTGWRAWADTCSFRDEVNPADGVSYPAICRDVPTYGTQQRLAAIMGRPVNLHALFLRLSLAGVPVPHQAHHDQAMGDFSLMLYLNRPEHCQGGTALLEHADGEPDEPTWRRDTNTPDKWRVLSLCQMRANSAFIFRSNLWHRAEPIGGFGDSTANGRLVMTGFFSL
jgi:hypothetical protein